MNNTLSVKKKSAPALFTNAPASSSSHTHKEYTKTENFLFKKHNFFVESNSTKKFSVYSYEANYDGVFLNITIKDSRNGITLKKLNPTIDSIAKRAKISNPDEIYSTSNIKAHKVVFESFCDSLFDYICDEIADDQEMGDF